MFGPLGLLSNRVNWLRNELDQLFDHHSPFAGWMGQRAFPALNLWEDGEHFYAEAELPGFKTADVEVSVVGNTLTLQGERKAKDEEGLAYHRRERAFGTFSRVVELPLPVQAEKVKAALKDGVLTITLPKAEEAKPRKIEVKLIEKK